MALPAILAVVGRVAAGAVGRAAASGLGRQMAKSAAMHTVAHALAGRHREPTPEPQPEPPYDAYPPRW